MKTMHVASTLHAQQRCPGNTPVKFLGGKMRYLTKHGIEGGSENVVGHPGGLT